MKAIVIATTDNRQDWLLECIESLNNYRNYPVIVLRDYEYELGKILFVYENFPEVEEFVLLQDSVHLKQTDWLDDVFNHDGGVSFAERPYFMYLGKYRRETLEKVGIPLVNSKKKAVEFESTWNELYAKSEKNLITMFDLRDTETFRNHLGRKNMIIENEYLIKYKHIWDESMIYDY